MKKIILSIFTLALSTLAVAQDYGTGELIRTTNAVVVTTNGTTAYLGLAKTFTAYSTPSPSAAVWKIIRTMYDTNGVFVGSQTPTEPVKAQMQFGAMSGQTESMPITNKGSL